MSLVEEEERSPLMVSSTVLSFVTFLIVASVAFERAKELLEEASDGALAPIVQSLFSELTVLGFLGLVSFGFDKLGVMSGFCDAAGWDGEEAEEECAELFEGVHMLLFALMVVFLAQSGRLLLVGRSMRNRWQRYRDLVLQKGAVSRLVAIAEGQGAKGQALGGWRAWLTARGRAAAAGEAESQAALDYSMIRAEFIAPRGRPVLPHDFDFAGYMTRALAEVIAEVVDVTPLTWVQVEGFCIAMFGVMVWTGLEPAKMYAAWLATSWGLLGAFVALRQRLRWIRQQLVVPPTVERRAALAQRHATNWRTVLQDSLVEPLVQPGQADPEAAPEPSATQHRGWRQAMKTWREAHGQVSQIMRLPPYALKASPQVRLSGRTPNRHEALFPFGGHGPHVILSFLRVTMIVQALTVTVLLLKLLGPLGEQTGRWGLAALMVAALAPLVPLNTHILPEVLSLFVMVTRIEMMRDPGLVREVQRDMAARRASKALAALTALRTLHLGTRGRGGGDAPAQLTPEAAALFAACDRDNSGGMSASELEGLLASLGHEMQQGECAALAATLDRDGDGTISKDEFAQWWSNIKSGVEPAGHEELAGDFFRFATGREDGAQCELGVEDVVGAFNRLGAGFKPGDVESLWKDLDDDHSGRVSLEEFTSFLDDIGETSREAVDA